MNLNIYNLNFFTLIRQFLCPLLRQEVMLALLQCIVKPVALFHATFLSFASDRRRLAGFVGHTICLEFLLNERFDSLLSGIYIENHRVVTDTIFLASDSDPVQFYLGTDAQPGGYLATDVELVPGNVNFTIYVPSRLEALLTDPAFRALVISKKLYGSDFAIKTY